MGGGVEEGQGDFAMSTEPNARLYPRPLIMTWDKKKAFNFFRCLTDWASQVTLYGRILINILQQKS